MVKTPKNLSADSQNPYANNIGLLQFFCNQRNKPAQTKLPDNPAYTFYELLWSTPTERVQFPKAFDSRKLKIPDFFDFAENPAKKLHFNYLALPLFFAGKNAGNPASDCTGIGPSSIKRLAYDCFFERSGRGFVARLSLL